MANMARTDQERKEQAQKLYERYGKPLESQHYGSYVAVSLEGKTVLGNTLLEVLQKATATLGPGNFIFKVGEEVVGQWR